MAPTTFAARAREELRRFAPSLRAAAAVSLCLLAGQLAGHVDAGVVMAVGARRVILSDPGGDLVARASNMVLALAGGALAAFIGTLAGNVVWLSALSMFAVGWASGVARTWGEPDGKAAATPTVLFAIALCFPAGPVDGLERAAAVVVGGTVGGLFLLGRLPFGRPLSGALTARMTTAVQRLRREAGHPPLDVRFPALVATTLSLGILVVKLLDVPRGYWVVISMLVVLRPERHLTVQRGLERIAGTIAGSLLGAALVYADLSFPLQHLLIFLLLAGAFRLLPESYGWTLVLLTPALVLIVSLLEPGNWHWAANRVVDVAIGAGVALLATFLFGLLPERAPAPPSVV